MTKEVLVIEDNREIGELYTLTLGMIGYEVLQITDGKTALEHLEEHVPRLLILDMNLPHVSGHFIYKKIRSSPKYDTTRVIISTANQIVAKNISEELDPRDHLLIKPVSPRKLQELIKALDTPEPADKPPQEE